MDSKLCDKYNRKVLQYKDCDNEGKKECQVPFVIFYKNTDMCPYSRDAFDILKKAKGLILALSPLSKGRELSSH